MSVLEADMSDARNLTMSTKELDRLEIIRRVLERRERAHLTLPGSTGEGAAPAVDLDDRGRQRVSALRTSCFVIP